MTFLELQDLAYSQAQAKGVEIVSGTVLEMRARTLWQEWAAKSGYRAVRLQGTTVSATGSYALPGFVRALLVVYDGDIIPPLPYSHLVGNTTDQALSVLGYVIRDGLITFTGGTGDIEADTTFEVVYISDLVEPAPDTSPDIPEYAQLFFVDELTHRLRYHHGGKAMTPMERRDRFELRKQFIHAISSRTTESALGIQPDPNWRARDA